MRASWFLPLALVACGDVHTSNALQNIDSSDPAAVERAAIGPWLEHGEQVPVIEDTLDAALRGRYAAGLLAADDYHEVVRTAAIEWVREVRRNLGDSLHTRVESLQDDPDCAGSVIGDAMLLDYVEAVTSASHRADRVEAALQALARQTACLEQIQSMRLAAAMAIAFDEAEMSLRVNQLDGAVPYLAQAIANPMLLVHEVERQWGEEAPLSRWFAEHEGALIEGVENRHQPASWHGLWLYDRMTATVRGFKASEKALDENTVELVALFHTVAQPTRTDLKCSFTEMVQRGSYDGRYHCLGDACAQGDERACAMPSSAGDSPPEKGAVDVPELSTSSALTCVANAVAHSSYREQLTCLVEATGRHAKPTESIAKQMTNASMDGLKPGGDCAVSATLSASITGFWNEAIKDAQRNVDYWTKFVADADRKNPIDELAKAQKGKLPTDPMSTEETFWTAVINGDGDEAKKKLIADAKARAAAVAAQAAAEIKQRARRTRAAALAPVERMAPTLVPPD